MINVSYMLRLFRIVYNQIMKFQKNLKLLDQGKKIILSNYLRKMNFSSVLFNRDNFLDILN